MNKIQARQNEIVSIIREDLGMSTSDILPLLSFKVSIKTLQRDLRSLEEMLFISSEGVGRNTLYFLSQLAKILKEINVDNYFKTPYLKREVKERFNFKIFDILKDDIFMQSEREKLEGLHKEFLTNFSKYNSQTIINKELERIMIEFSWRSSVIEGNTYSLLGTEALLKNNVVSEGKTEAETQMIINHKDAFNEVILNKDRFIKLKSSDIEYIHSVLTKKLGISRNIRKEGVGVTGTKYKPLDNEPQIKEAMEKMIKLINKKKSFFEKAFLISTLIAYIQIFEDGNKRTSRMMSNAILLAYNSIPLSYRIVDVEEYKKAVILFYELNNISYLKQIFIDQFEDAVSAYFK